jgi:predicted negative regulator of RcsB-dependent stress response
VDHYASEQEQIDQLKSWWKENGKSLILGLVLGVGGLAGYRYWDASETARAENASVTYEQFLQMAQAQRIDDAKKTGRAIIDNYADSIYARLSALLLAKIAIDKGENDDARGLLVKLVDDKKDTQIAYIARARLARIELAEGHPEAASELLKGVPANEENQRFTELRGDIMVANGDVDAARGLYLKALVQAETLGLKRDAIQLKLDNLRAGAMVGGA